MINEISDQAISLEEGHAKNEMPQITLGQLGLCSSLGQEGISRISFAISLS
jgi:hypothetical protein